MKRTAKTNPQDILNSNHCGLSIIHNNTSSNEKAQKWCLQNEWTVGLLWCGLMWCFISCLDSHSDGTHSLQSIWCNATFLQSVLLKKPPPHLERPEDEYILSTCSFESPFRLAQWWETTAHQLHTYIQTHRTRLSGSLSRFTFAFVHLARRFYPQRHTTEGNSHLS